jgi:hypothetical protein
MRKIIAFDMLSVDLCFAGRGGEVDWHIVDQEFNACVIDMLRHADMLIFGRVPMT